MDKVDDTTTVIYPKADTYNLIPRVMVIFLKTYP